MTRPRRIPARVPRLDVIDAKTPLRLAVAAALAYPVPAMATLPHVGRPGPPQGLRPEIALIIEELARAAVRRQDRHALKAATAEDQDNSK
jgi:hypothetical protein